MLKSVEKFGGLTDREACVFVWLCLSVCPHDKTKTAESTITKLGTEIVDQDTLPTNEY